MPYQELWEETLELFGSNENLKDYMFPDPNFLADFSKGRWTTFGW